jgi:hypothetical protein
VNARRLTERVAYVLVATIAALLIVLAVGCAVHRWEVVPVEHTGRNTEVPPAAVAFVVPVASRSVHAGDQIYIRARRHSAPSLRRVSDVVDSFKSRMRLDGTEPDDPTVQLAATTWRVRTLIAYLGFLLRLIVGPIQSAVLIIGGAALLLIGERDRLWRGRSPGGAARRVRWKPFVAGGVVAVMIAGAAIAARAEMIASVSDSIDVSTKAMFAIKPTCRWTDHAETTISWTDDPDATSYDVLRSDTAVGGYVSLGNVGEAVNSYVDSTVNPDPVAQGQYYYEIQSNTAGGNSAGRHTSTTTECPGYVTTYAGGAGADALAAVSTAQQPHSLAIDGTTMYVAEKNALVRAIDMTNGHESIVGGTPHPGETGDGGPATLAGLTDLGGIAVDSDGNRYVADRHSQVIRKITPGGTISLFAGAYDSPCSAPTDVCGDGGLATSAQLGDPVDVAVDSHDNVYIADRATNRVRMVASANGNISTVAGTGDACADPTDPCGDGDTATDADLKSPSSVALDPDDNLYIADTGDHRIRVVAAANGDISAYAGDGIVGTMKFDVNGGASSSASLGWPTGLYINDDGAMYVAEQSVTDIRKIDSGVITTAVGTTAYGSSPDGTTSTEARLPGVYAITGDANGNVYFAEGRRVRIATADGTLGTVAGSAASCDATDPCGDGGPATEAAFGSGIGGVARDDVGNLYISDTLHSRIRKVSPSGMITTFAGTGDDCASPTDMCGDGGDPSDAHLHHPNGLFWTGSALLVADTGDNRIRKITVTGEANDPDRITTIAGVGSAGDSGDGAAATDAELRAPEMMYEVDASHIYIADTGNHRVRVAVDGGNINAYAGDGTTAFGGFGDGADAVDARLAKPVGLAYDSGTLYISDKDDNRIRSVTAGTIETFAGTGITPQFENNGQTATDSHLDAPVGLSWDAGSNALYFAQPDLHTVWKVAGGVTSLVAGDGVAGFAHSNFSLRLDTPTDVVVDGDGNIYIADDANNRIMELQFGVVPVVYAGTGDVSFLDSSTAADARFGTLSGMVRAANGDIYVSDPDNHRVRKITTNGVITTLAGTGELPTYGRDGSAATSAQLSGPGGMARDQAGNLYIVDPNENRVRKLSPDGTMDTFAGSGYYGMTNDGGAATDGTLAKPTAVVADDDGNVYIADGENNRIRKVDTSGIITVFAGTGVGCASGPCGDGGLATDAKLDLPSALVFDNDGNLLVAEKSGNRVRKIDMGDGTISRYAGTGDPGGSGDGGAATAAELHSPTALAWDAANGELYIADSMSYRVRKVDAGGDISTVLGTAYGDSGDGGAGTSAAIGTVSGLAYNPGNGSLYVADSDIGRIRELRANGNVYAFSGSTSSYGGDDGPYDDASVHYSSLGGLYFDFWGTSDGSLGALYVADAGNRRVREISLDTNYIRTIAGDGNAARYFGDGSEAGAQLDCPGALALDGDGTLYIADPCVHRVRVFDVNGTERQSVGGPSSGGQVIDPAALAVDDDGVLYIAEPGSHNVWVFDSMSTSLTVVAGTGVSGSDGDGGPATDAKLAQPLALAWHAGKLYIADCDSRNVRVVDGVGDISTFAGTGDIAASGDGGLATAAGIGCPMALGVDGSGNSFIAALTSNSVEIRRVDHGTGDISTVVKTVTLGFYGDRGGPFNFGFAFPSAMVFDADDNLYLAAGDPLLLLGPYNGVVRRIVGPL